MKYKVLSNSTENNTKFPKREINIKADEIPEITVTGEQYFHINTDKGLILIDAITNDELRLTVYAPTNKKFQISKSKTVQMSIRDF